MTPTKHLFPLTLCVAALACAPEPGLDAVESAPGALVRCEDGDLTQHFDFAQLNGNLDASPELAQVVGLTRVGTCADARHYLERLNAFQEALTVQDDLHMAVDALPEPPTPVGRQVQAIMNADGTNQSQAGVVEVGGGCTGIVITDRAILTAAHCVDDLIAPAKNGNLNLSIRRYTPSEVLVYSGTVRVNVHPDYSGDGDTGDDVAVIKLFAPDTFGLGAEHKTRIYTGSMDTIGTMRLYGRGFSDKDGTGSSVLRFMYFNPSWTGPEHYLEDAGESRVCRGDSGGPTIDWTPSGFRVVAGLHSNSEKSITSGDCARWLGKQRSVRLQNKITWIEDMLDVTCTPFNDGGWSYVRCW